MPWPVHVSGVLCWTLAAVLAAAAQQSAPRPAKVLTPEQMTYQQQMREWFAHHHQLQAQGKQLFDDETAREKAGDCPTAQSTVEFETCYAKQIEITNGNLKSYEEVIRGLLSPPPQMPGAPAEMIGPGGRALSAQDLIDEFNHVEAAWLQYRETACTAAYHQFDGGTGGPPFQQECTLKLTRDHLRELDMIYGNVLHL